jgi:hypothetical protein
MRPHNHGQRDLAIYAAIKMGARPIDQARIHGVSYEWIRLINHKIRREREEAERPPEPPPRRKPKGLYACYAKPLRR